MDHLPPEFLISRVAASCLFTMTAASVKDSRQTIPKGPHVPTEDIRMLRARLILEEALETIGALGVEIQTRSRDQIKNMADVSLSQGTQGSSIEDVIDGCCDTIYVATGTLCAFGVPDLPHLTEICKCNDAKFPFGIALTDEHGKYLKPKGWKGPDHLRQFSIGCDLSEIGRDLVKLAEKTITQ